MDEVNGGYDSIISPVDVNVRSFVDITVNDGISTYTSRIDVFPDTRSSVKPYVYVSDYYRNSIYVVDTETRSIVYTIHTDHGPGELALSHDSTRLYAGSNDRVMVIDTRTNSVVDSIPVANGASRIELSPDDKKLYVVTDLTSNRISPSGYIAVIDIASKTRIGTIGEVPNIGGMAVSTDGQYIYVSDYWNVELNVYSTSDYTRVENLLVSLPSAYKYQYWWNGYRCWNCGVATDVVASPDGEDIYVALWTSNDLSIIDPHSLTVEKTITIAPRSCDGLAITVDSTRVYASNVGGNCVSIVDAVTETYLGALWTGSQPMRIAVSSDGRSLVVCHASDKVKIVDIATGTTYNLGIYGGSVVASRIPVMLPLDSDDDGLPDIVEDIGFVDQFGNFINTDPSNADSDFDGLYDGEEAGSINRVNGCTIFTIKSHPRLNDTDNDRIDDVDEDEFGTSRLDDNCDLDTQDDGFELDIGTEPLMEDTDYDRWSDSDEYYGSYDEYGMLIAQPSDPLVNEERYTSLEAFRDFMTGLVYGEWATENNDSLFFYIGMFFSSLWDIGDLKDLPALLLKGDWFGFITTVSSIIAPVIGDFVKVAGKYAVDHGDEWLTFACYAFKVVDPDDANALRKAVDDAIGADAANSLRNKGFTDEVIASLIKQNIDVKRLNDILEKSKLYDDFRYDKLAEFVSELSLKGSKLTGRCTIEIKKMVSADKAGQWHRVQGYLGNLKGAYTESKAFDNIPGSVILDLKHVNAGGIDFVKMDQGVVNIVEAKAKNALTTNDLKNYLVLDANNVPVKFNMNYVIRGKGKIKGIGEGYIDTPKKFTLYLNGANSENIKNSLNLPSKLPYEYRDSRNILHTGTVDIEVVTVNI